MSEPASDPKELGDRVAKWRKANKALYLERQRAYAKKHRAKEEGCTTIEAMLT